MADEPLTYSVEQTARLLGLSRGATYQAVRTGQLPSLRVGRRLLIPVASLLKLLAEVGNGKAG